MKLFKLLVWFSFYLIYSAQTLKEVKNEDGYCQVLKFDMAKALMDKEVSNLLVSNRKPTNVVIRYDLYTYFNKNERQVLKPNDKETLYSSFFNRLWPVRISIHGWNGNAEACTQADIKDAYLAKGDFNVILVDWSEDAFDLDYELVATRVKQISKQIVEFTRFLHSATGVSYEDMYLIGHSLGAHIAGTVGKMLKPNSYGAIFALDPAGLLFTDPKVSTRLSPTDANYVEAIHTDVGFLGQSGRNMAHASFYPNWGLGQPHCPHIANKASGLVCDHMSSIDYFTESVRRDKAFGAINCSHYDSIQQRSCQCPHSTQSCEAKVYMGGEPAVHKRGIFYLSTRDEKPLGYGQKCEVKDALMPSIARVGTHMAVEAAQTVLEKALGFLGSFS